ncbi:ImmA/IrrE family metallo-endopeptidase [Mycobacterium sp. UM_CSW]|uniref:ImmA/IrrE family metallo-endopeptidase n=1 Tax=Mycobacterium sp. UM_CSW TaxID=1370119 RepID=UPI0009DBDA2C|nr:ImmA/IrrE family metallo-endopeptidase [Mycobacterium sp. UM_CSW]
MSHQTNQRRSANVLGALRAIIPNRDNITYAEALRIAELQANKLLNLSRITEPSVPSEVITTLPNVKIELIKSVASGASFWDKQRRTWVIHLSRSDSRCRCRFTLAHEFKHIIDHGSRRMLYRGSRRTSAETQAERVADYFAGCLLVPRRLLTRAWHNGVHKTCDLAKLFCVSEQAISVRLRQTRLVQRTPCPPVADSTNTPEPETSPEETA